MAEFAASIAGLVTTTEVVCTRIYKYIKQVKDATREVLELSAEVNGLYGTLKSISLVIDGIEGACGTTIVDHAQITECTTALDRLRDKLAPFQDSSGGKTDGPRRKWKWPFARSETLAFKQQIESYKASLSLALSADGVCATLEMLSEAKSISRGVGNLHLLLQAQARIQLNEEKEEILAKIGPRNPLRHHQTNMELHQSGTGTWFVDGEIFQQWLRTKNSKIWVYGIPGAGKSILAALALTEIIGSSDQDNAVAYFYCDYKDAGTQDPLQILGSLAEQVARQSEPSFQKLSKFVKNHCHGDRLQTFRCVSEDLCELIVDMSYGFRNLTIAVDGLDECGDNVRLVTKLVTNLGHNSARIRTFISSRNLVDIRDFTDDFVAISIAATSIDLRLYVGAEIEERMQKFSRKRLYLTDPTLKGEIVDRLIDGAEGMFRWVAVQLDYICEQGSDADIRVALRSLPPDLFSCYERLLHDINKKPTATQILVQQALKWIVWTGPISGEALGEALAVKKGLGHFDTTAKVSQERILQLCGSLIRQSVDGCYLESAHFTVKEFLINLGEDLQSKLNPYGLIEKVDYEYFATIALSYLCSDDLGGPDLAKGQVYTNNWEDFNALISRAQGENFFSLAANYALFWARNEPPELHDLLKRLFSHSRQPVRSLTLYLEFECAGIHWEERRFFEMLEYITPLHYAAMMRLPRLCESLLMGQQDCNTKSPLGTPLQCAVLGLDVGRFEDGFEPTQLTRDYDFNDEYENTTLQLLIDRGADASVTFLNSENVNANYSILYPVLREETPFPREILRKLLDAGALYCEACLDVLQGCLNTDSGNTEASSGISALIESLKPEHVRPGLESYLLSLSFAVSHRLHEEGDEKVERVLEACIDPEAIQNLLSRAIRYDDLETLRILLDQKIIDASWRTETNKNAMHFAIEENSLEAAELFFSHDIPLNQQSQDGGTLLHLAVAISSSQLIQFLLLRGADTGKVDNQGRNILHIAAELEEPHALKVLITSLDTCKALVDERDFEGQTPLISACENYGSAEHVKLLAEVHADRAIKDFIGWAAIHHAVDCGRLDIIQILADDHICWTDTCTVNMLGREYDGLLLTYLAAIRGYENCLKFLLESADLFSIHDQVRDWSLMHFATISGNSHVVEYLFEKGVGFTTLAQRFSPLHLAVESKNVDMIQVLLRYGHETFVTDCNGVTPMSIAWRKKYDHIVSLLRKGRAAQEELPSTPGLGKSGSEKAALRLFKVKQHDLTLATRYGDIPYIQSLIREDASLLSVLSYDCNGCGLLTEALAFQQVDTALFLIKQGVTLNGTTCVRHQFRGYTAIHYCARFNYNTILREIIDRSPGLLFISSEIHPVHIAIANRSNDCLRIMLERSEEAWQKSTCRLTGLFEIAPPTNHNTCIGFERRIWPKTRPKLPILAPQDLIQVSMRFPLSAIWNLSANLNSTAALPEWSSPIHFATCIANIDAVGILLDHGASASDMPEGLTCTPLHLALYREFWDVVNLLLKRGASLQSRDIWGNTCAELIRWRRIDRLPAKVAMQASNFLRSNLIGRSFAPGFSPGPDVQMRIFSGEKTTNLITFDQHGEAAIFEVWHSRSVQLQNCVLSLGLNLGLLNKAFGSCLHFYWQDRNISLLKRLLNRIGVSESKDLLNFKPEHRNTPLYNAAAMDQRKITELMLKHGAQIDLIGGVEGSPLMVAAAYGRLKTVRMLIDAGASTSYFDPKYEITTSVLEKAKDFPEIQRWLLVERWTEMRFIEWKDNAEECESG